FGVVPNFAAIPTSVSPDLILYVRVPTTDGPAEAACPDATGPDEDPALDPADPLGWLVAGSPLVPAVAPKLPTGVGTVAPSTTPGSPPVAVNLAATIATNARASRITRIAWPDRRSPRSAGSATAIGPWSRTTGVVRATGRGSV